ncbi:hypothetical protein G3M48_005534 [Beauveria asiatica]|uniref:Uncharacterized protein n=1 Tax=Beauveria asiatica TaxID=1069075 RepID=A0AAW0S691_9HYPO
MVVALYGGIAFAKDAHSHLWSRKLSSSASHRPTKSAQHFRQRDRSTIGRKTGRESAREQQDDSARRPASGAADVANVAAVSDMPVDLEQHGPSRDKNGGRAGTESAAANI